MRLLCAVQSQDYSGAKWSVGQRVRNGTDAMVEQAFTSGRILRTHVLRPTWHFVTPADIRWILELTAPHVHRLNAFMYRTLDLDQPLFRKAHAAIAKSLCDGKELTRTELATVLKKAGIVAGGPRLAYIVMHAELEGLVCSGAVRGKQHTYALLEDRAARAKRLQRDEALAELAHRFFTGHAPATLAHFIWWSGLPVKDARQGLAAARPRLTSELIGGAEWFGATRKAAPRAPLTAWLVPEYDEALVGSKDMAVPDLPRSAGPGSWKDEWYRPVLIGGRRAGTWRRTIAGRKAVLETNLFTSLSSAQSRALEVAVERYGRYLGMPAILAES